MRRTAVFVFSILLVVCLGCGPSVNVAPRIVDDQLVFDIKTRGVNKVFSLRVEDESGNKIWVVIDPDMINKQPVVYGALPEGSGVHAGVGQTYPAENKPPE